MQSLNISLNLSYIHILNFIFWTLNIFLEVYMVHREQTTSYTLYTLQLLNIVHNFLHCT